jgi:hypothetical protein
MRCTFTATELIAFVTETPVSAFPTLEDIVVLAINGEQPIVPTQAL